MFLTIPLQFTMVKTVDVFSLFYLLLTFCSLDVGVQGQSKSLANVSRFPYRNANKFVLRAQLHEVRTETHSPDCYTYRNKKVFIFLSLFY